MALLPDFAYALAGIGFLKRKNVASVRSNAGQHAVS